MEKLVKFSFYFFVVWQTLNGVIRFLLLHLGNSGILLLYLDKLVLIFTLYYYLLHSFSKTKIRKSFLILIIILTIPLVASLIYINNKIQILFGIWVLLPFMFGFSFGGYLDIYRMKKFFLFIYIISTIGVLFVSYFKAPWVGATYNIGESVIEVSREWYVFGILRSPGFGRISATTSTIILLSSLVIIFLFRNTILKVFLWLISGIAIFLTLTKTSIVLWLLLSLLFIMYNRKFRLFFTKVLIICIIVLSVVLPWLSYYYHNEVNYDIISNPLLLSFRDRIETMWPGTIDILLNKGSLLIGRGIGGIGAPQFYFEKEIYTPADNMALYAYGIWGVLSFIFFTLIIFFLIYKRRRGYEEIYIYMLIVAFMWGITINSLENPVLAMFLGISLYNLFLKNSYDRSKKVNWYGSNNSY